MGAGMKNLKIYLPTALAAFAASTTGADVLARMNVACQQFEAALQESLYYLGVGLVGTILLLAPFFTVAFICALAEKYGRTRSISIIFAVATAALIYFYFQGNFGAQEALKEKHWTAAALSVGLLPFFIGVPVALVTAAAAALAAKLDSRRSV
jgi:hypothetical protein